MQSPSFTTITSDADITALDLDANTMSGLNPNAPAFVPSWQVTDSTEQRKVDDAMSMMHHFVTVNDTETLLEAEQWLGAHPSEWVANGAEWIASADVEGPMGYYIDREEALLSDLYCAPQKPKGNTAGRRRA